MIPQFLPMDDRQMATAMFRDGLRGILASLDIDPDGDAVRDTPDRWLRALREMTTGYQVDVEAVLSRTFDIQHGGDMVVLRDIPFTSLCAHHLLPFHGRGAVAYIPAPGARLVGLSKLARVLDAYARRLTSQEEITAQVTAALDRHLQTQGSACVLVATHGCMAHRGVMKPGADMVTSSLTGAFRENPETRAEFMALATR